MRWLSGMCVVVLAVAGCGSGGGDDSVMQFQGFNSTDITQSDAVRQTSADVDVCLGLCGATLSAEPYTQTTINAVFVNSGKADIVLDRYTVSVPGSGVPDVERSISARLVGGRCVNDAQQKCASDNDCQLSQCQRSESTVNLLLYDFQFKSLVVEGQCPFDPDTGQFTGGTVISRTFDAFITFSGEDEANRRFTVETAYVSTFNDFNNCTSN